MTVTINGTTGIDKVQNGVVTSDSIADGAVTPTDLSTGKPSWDSSGNLSFNSGYGSVATAYGCRAWVNFNGTGAVAIRASGNVSSIGDNAAGDYTVNFTNSMPDANYAVCGIGPTVGGTNGATIQLRPDLVPQQASSVRIGTQVNNVLTDQAYMQIAVFR